MKKVYLLAITALFNSTMALAATVIPTENMLCTRDLNEWRQASRCFCPVETQYDERIGRCTQGETQPIEISGILQTQIMAIGGETTGVVLKGADRHQYELILPTELLNELNSLQTQGLNYKVTGEYIEIPGVEIPSRPSIIVESLSPLAE